MKNRISDILANPTKRRATVLGLGRSGIEGAKLCHRLGMQVTVSEQRKRPAVLDRANPLEEMGIELEYGGHSPAAIADADLIITSPGIPPDATALRQARESDIPVIGELDFAAGLASMPLIAVTGTNGKTTTTALLGSLLHGCDYRTFVGGNIGIPLSRAVANEENYDVAVIECSSFQLQNARYLKAHIAVVLNITPDHLDWHADLDEYVAAKKRLLELQAPEDFAVLNSDDPRVREMAKNIPAHIYCFGRDEQHCRRGLLLRGDWAYSLDFSQSSQTEIHLDHPLLTGSHNRENAAAAMCAAILFGAPVDQLSREYQKFCGVPHRLEPLGTTRNISFYNDSKATNDQAAATGVAAFDRPVLLLAGGKDKGTGYEQLQQAARQHIKHAFLFGESAPIMQRALHGIVSTSEHHALPEALQAAWREAVEGDIIVLSPACSSYDQYDNYEQRGNHFKELVGQIITASPSPGETLC